MPVILGKVSEPDPHQNEAASQYFYFILFGMVA
jgi:hypothetical protein